jgi:hypothetical protein
LSFSNGANTYNYALGSGTVLTEAMFGFRLAQPKIGSLFLEMGIAYAGLSAQIAATDSSPASSLNLYTVGLDTRLGFYFDRLPVAWLIPFVDAGGQNAFYFQSGSSDLDSASGWAGNFAAGAGLRVWLNPSSLNRDYFARSPGFPIYLSFKVNRIFPTGAALDLSDTDWLAGLTVGL